MKVVIVKPKHVTRLCTAMAIVYNIRYDLQ